MKTIPVVVLIGSYAEKDVVGSYELDASIYTVKPINLAQQTMIEDLLEKHGCKSDIRASVRPSAE